MPEAASSQSKPHNVIVDEKWAAARPPIQAGAYVLLALQNTGQGMDAMTKARIFEPFFTTKSKGRDRDWASPPFMAL